jgi:hypothetical protein
VPSSRQAPVKVASNGPYDRVLVGARWGLLDAVECQVVDEDDSHDVCSPVDSR